MENDIDELKVLKICLVHDLPEARTGDMNYMYKKYVTVDEHKALKELTETLFFGRDIEEAIAEFNERKTKESLIAHDADQLSLILQLKECGDLGNKYSQDWMKFASQRLYTQTAKSLAETIFNTDSSDWWFKDKSDWWINGNNSK
jgi:putative hydrolase of HD superfamily